MDADDRFDGASKRQLNTLLKTGMPQAASFCIINEQNNLPGAQFMQVRLFPRMEGLFFERRIHEQIMFGALRRKIPFTQYPSIRILHKGYNDPTMIQAKSARNKPLILSELKNQPNDPALLLNYGDCCVALGQLDGAYAAYSLIASNKDVRQAHPDVYVQAHLNIGCICNKRKDFAFAKHWFSQCIRLDSTRTDAYYFLGRILEAQGEEELAFENYLMSARLSPPPRQTATNVRKIRIESIHCLARLMLASRRLSEAELLLIHAIAAFPEVVEFHTALGNALLMQQKFKDAAHFFMQSLSLSNEGNRESYEGMAKIYETVGDFGAAKEFLEMAAR
jgi:tetratricopeptide (TPR) repeat protein